ncbi:hypothetical protein SAMN04489724_0827 [Algoriphagus locisalis]|uniref:Oligosaccharide repeat unit polymerase n=1 Tax=Algoriphagus locisalis TaxID=305507 RepID=A0A1I6Y5I6_9BACT|nr:hypothetical protein [Algoriphagus locisalis]SFT45521.1 hypothetical protein SAMN04489724_0827 [Algoriphagus locisalis]
MKLNIRSYSLFFFLISSFVFLFYNVKVSLIYFFVFLAYIFFDNIPINNPIVKRGYVVVLFAFLISYFVRGIILSIFPEFFMFAFFTDYYPNRLDIITSLFDVFIFFTIFSIGFMLSYYSLKKIINIVEFKFSFAKRSWPLLYFNSLTYIFFTLIFIKLILYIIFNAGVKGEEVSTPLVFLLRFIPEDLIFIYAVLLYVKYPDFAKKNWIRIISLVGLMSLSILLTGSKLFILLLLFCFIIVSILFNYKFNVFKFLKLSISIFIILVISFAVSAVIKFQNPSNLFDFVVYVSDYIDSNNFIIILDSISSRFIGLDGYILSKNFVTNGVDEVMSDVYGLQQTLVRVVDYIIPFGKFTDSIGTGKAVSVYVFGFDMDHLFGGALGVFGSLLIGNSTFVEFAVFGYGIFISFIYLLLSRIFDDDLKIIFFYIFSYFLIHSFMSGNFDRLIGLLIIKIVLTIVYIYISFILTKVKLN